MKAASAAAFATLLVFAAASAAAAEARSYRAKSDFRAGNPCPSTGKASGACPGYVVDHAVPLCAGGPDSVPNMQWQTVAEAKIKDREERRQCRELRKRRTDRDAGRPTGGAVR